MKFHRTYSPDKGFSLVEVLISIAILLVLAGIGTPYTLNMYRRYQLISERIILTSLLREARTLSMSGAGGSDYGVHIASSQFTLFEGPSYASRTQSKDQTFTRETNVTITGPSEFTFKYLTGNTASKSFTLTNTTKTGKIYVNKQGRIDWN